MATVILVIHLMIAAALVGVVLLQRSEGGALGIGGGGGGFLTGRGTANLLTRVTAGLAAAFFTTSVILSILAQQATAPGSILDRATATAPAGAGAPATGEQPKAPEPGRGGVLDRLQKQPAGPAIPQTR